MSDTNPASKKNKTALHFDWILPVIIKPRKMITKIVSEDKPTWLTPLIVVSVLIVLSVIFAAPVQRTAIQMGQQIPEDFQYYSAEDQAAYMDAQANQTSPLFLYVFPVLLKAAGLWVSWFILSSLLHLSLTLSGSRAGSMRSYNLAGWSFLPIGVRYLVQIGFMLISKKAINAAGLSGLIAADASGFAGFIALVLAALDIYFIWQIILLVIGVVPLSGLSKSKAWIATAVSLLILVLLQTIPGLLSNALSGLSLSGMYF